jgi:acylphosphatase
MEYRLEYRFIVSDERSSPMHKASAQTRIETYLVRARGVLHRYRNSAVRRAHSLGIRGWIRDVDDGSIEALVQGPPDQIDLMLEWMRRGAPGNNVQEFDSRESDIDRRFERFEQQ